jgi:hypothetical protein
MAKQRFVNHVAHFLILARVSANAVRAISENATLSIQSRLGRPGWYVSTAMLPNAPRKADSENSSSECMPLQFTGIEMGSRRKALVGRK